MVIAGAASERGEASEIYPTPQLLDPTIPNRAREFLAQAISCIHAPAGSILLAASAVDAMLKTKGYVEGNLYKRINQARDDNLLTSGMAEWAHAVRLDANDQRHADENVPLPTETDARHSVDFVLALAQFLYVLPERVKLGLASVRV